MASPVDVFADMVMSTSSTVFSGAEQIVNDAQRHRNYYTRFEHSGGDKSKMVQGGPNIFDTIFLNATPRSRFYNPSNDTFSYLRADVLTSWQIAWRYNFTHMAWTDHEILHNVNSLSGQARTLKYKSIRKAKDLDVYTDLIDTIEATAWAAPVQTTMETATGTQPYSVLAFCNEGTAGAGELPTWTTTVQNISSTTYPNWLPQRASYADLPKVGTDLFEAFSTAQHKAKWEAMPYRGDASTPSSVSEMSWFTALDGLVNYETSLRLNQDEFKNGSNGQDPHYGAPTFRGRPIIYVSALDGAAVWPTGTAGALATSATTTNSNAGPRYVGLNNEHVKCVWHSDRYMVKLAPMRPTDQPFTTVVPMDTWTNRVCSSRRRQACVFPSATLT